MTFIRMKLPKIPWGGVKPEYLIAAIKYQKLKRELGIPLDATVLLSVGEVNVNKNHKVVIEALPELKDYWYVLCGCGPLMNDYRKLSESLNVSDRFIMTGYRRDVVNFYAMADIFVFPSYREGLPVALMEAMAAGLPCVAARNRGTDDLLEGSELLFDAEDSKTVKTILLSINEFAATKEISRNRICLQKYSVENTEVLMRQIYIENTKP